MWHIGGDQILSPEEEGEQYPYCGRIDKKPRPCINPYDDVLLRDFLYCCIDDPKYNFFIWMESIVSIINFDKIIT